MTLSLVSRTTGTARFVRVFAASFVLPALVASYSLLAGEVDLPLPFPVFMLFGIIGLSMPPALLDAFVLGGNRFEFGIGIAPRGFEGWAFFLGFYAVGSLLVAALAQWRGRVLEKRRAPRDR